MQETKCHRSKNQSKLRSEIQGTMDKVSTKDSTTGKKHFCTCRHVVAMLGFCSFFVLGSQRINVSVALVAMVNRSIQIDLRNVSDSQNVSSECLQQEDYATEDVTEKVDGEFDWSPELENYVLSAGFAGFVLSLTPGGVLADAWSPKNVLAFGVFLSSVCTMISPFGCRWSIYCLIVLQFIKGIGQGVIQPALGCLMARWFPKGELASLSGVIYSGGRAGNLIGGVVSGILCEVKFLGGWPLAFYVFGFIGCIFFVILCIFLYETPAQHPKIEASELTYITMDSKNTFAKKPPTPWLAIFRSPSTWALFISMFGLYWFPMYFVSVHSVFLGSILHFPISQIGIITSSPYILQATITIAAGSLSDWVFRKKYASVNFIRKTNNLASAVIISLGVMGACFSSCDKWLNVAFFTIAMGGSGLSNAGCFVVPVDMSPTFAGTLTGIGTTVGFLSATIIPIITGKILKEEQTFSQWRKIFMVTIFVTMIGAFIFLFFGSANVQPWNNSKKDIRRKQSNGVSEPEVHQKQTNWEEKTNHPDILYSTHL